jgi:hypothetical protein
MNRFTQFWDYITGTNKQGAGAVPSALPYDYTGLYQSLYDLYNNDDALYAEDTSRRLRTVVNRSVEFYATKMLPGPKIEVMLEADKPEDLKTAIEQILKSSNFGNNKPAMLRGFALYGDSFIRVRGDNEKSFLEDVSPFFVTDFDEDTRGFLTFMRIDIPTLDASNNPALYTEVWQLSDLTFRSWLTSLSVSTPIDQLGTPAISMSFSELGIDFIPIVHTKFRDVGDLRGIGSVFHALDKIIEANRLVTRLHDLLFRFDKPIFMVSANDKDQAGRPLPAPKIDTASTGSATASEGEKESVFGDVVYLPGMAKAESMIPNINYSDALAILNAHMEEIERDLPELRWYALKMDTTLSGTALRTLLGAAIDRATEAKNNFLSSLSRALEMALTIGIFNGVFPATLGTFDSGDFDHQLVVEDAWAQSVSEKADTQKKLVDAGVPVPAAMKLAGFTDEEIAAAFPAGQAPAPAAKTTPGRSRVTLGGLLAHVSGADGQSTVRVG